MKVLFPPWTSAKADEAKLTALHDLAMDLLVQGIHPDMSAAQMHLLTVKMPSKDLSSLKKSMLRPGFVAEWNDLDHQASAFAKVLLSKQNAKPSATYKLFMSYDPEAILWLGFTSKDKTAQERFHNFLKVWPEARQRIPHALMQEMRITPELPAYADIVQAIFLELIDGRLNTPEEMRAFLEPHSPPAPPPQVTVKRPRVRRTEAKIKEPAFDEETDEDGLVVEGEEDLEPVVADDEELDLAVLPKGALALDIEEDEESEEEDLEDEEAAAAPARKKGAIAEPAAKKGQKPAPSKAEKPLSAKPEPSRPAPEAKGKHAEKTAVAKPASAKPTAAGAQQKPASAPAKAPAPASKKPTPAAASAKKPITAKPTVKSKPPAKAPAKKPAKPAPKSKPAPAKAKPGKKAATKPSKPAAKKPAAKAAKKR